MIQALKEENKTQSKVFVKPNLHMVFFLPQPVTDLFAAVSPQRAWLTTSQWAVFLVKISYLTIPKLKMGWLL